MEDLIMALGKISLLFGSLLTAVFGGRTAKEPEFNHALFFIGNGAYYALNATDSLNNPNPYDPYTTYDQFIRNFIPDSIVSDFTRALHEKEPHIFINAKIWNSLVRARNRAMQLFTALSIPNPLEQIYIDNTTVIPTHVSNQLEKELVLTNTGTQICNTSNAPRTTIWNHPLFFSINDTQTLKLLPLKKRLEHIKQKATILHPEFHRIFHFLYVFNPAEWRLYDTNMGMYYLTLKNGKQSTIATHNFTELNTQNALEDGIPEPSETQEFVWTQQLDKIFSQNTSHWRAYISGHGSKLVTTPSGTTEEHCVESQGTRRCTRAQIAGMPSINFKQILQFFNEKIKTDRMVVSSCFTPAQRLLQLHAGAFNFDLITPIQDYVEVKSFAPLIYTSQYAPAWLTDTGTHKLEYIVHNSGDKDRTPIKTFKKFVVLLDTKVSDLTSYMHNLYDPQQSQEPTIVYAGRATAQ